MHDKNIKTAFYGTSDFGLPAVKWLHENTDLRAVISTPDKPAGRGQELKSSPIKEWALSQNLAVIQPEDLEDPLFRQELAGLNLDAAIVAAYGKIIPEEILNIPKKRSVNLHASLLPKYRGAAPVQAAILSGDKTTGITLMLMDKKLDHGSIIAQREVPIDREDDFESLYGKLSDDAVFVLADHFQEYIEGKIEPEIQDHKQATYFHKISKEDGRIDWNKSNEYIERQVRAFNPWPGTFTKLMGSDKIMKIFKIKTDQSTHALEPGQLLIENDRIFVGTGTFPVEVLELQVGGSRRMTSSEFTKGFREEVGYLE